MIGGVIIRLTTNGILGFIKRYRGFVGRLKRATSMGVMIKLSFVCDCQVNWSVKVNNLNVTGVINIGPRTSQLTKNSNRQRYIFAAFFDWKFLAYLLSN